MNDSSSPLYFILFMGLLSLFILSAQHIHINKENTNIEDYRYKLMGEERMRNVSRLE